MSFFKYLAIGDSIAQGFNSKVSSKTNGFKIKGGEFYSGYSYTDYFLEYIYYYIQKNERKIAELKNFWTNLEYKNIALAAARISDINKILNNKIDDDLRSIINFNKELFNYSNLKTNEEDFWSSNTNNELSKKFIDEIKESNLISISIGGNEFQSSIPFYLFKKVITENNYFIRKELMQKFYDSLKKVSLNIQDNLIRLIYQIKNINPNTYIVIIGYPMAFMTLILYHQKLLNKRFKNSMHDFYDNILKTLNLSLENAANATNSIYVNTFNFKYWTKNNKYFNQNVFDVHPTEIGYQEMGRQFFIKIVDKKIIENIKRENVSSIIFKNKYSNNKKISIFLSKDKKFKKAFSLPDNINKIANIFKCWFQQEKDITNPYFLLFKKELSNFSHDYYSKDVFANITDRKKYTSITELIFDNFLYIFTYLPKNSKLLNFESYKSETHHFSESHFLNCPL